MIARHGCLLSLVLAIPLCAGDAPSVHEVVKVQTRRFDIEYQVNEESLPLSRVELWYSRDRGQTWHNFGLDQDSQSPISFDAAEEGGYGFYFVLANHVGVSAPLPQPDTLPQQWAFVDYTPPILQIRPLSAEHEAAVRVVRIRWTALDDHFEARPIQLAYRFAPDEEWRQIGEPLANTGLYDWRPPEDLEGRVVVRVSACDKGGNRVEAVARAMDLVETVVAAPAVAGPVVAAAAPDITITGPLPAGALDRADKIFRRGVAHKERGEYRLAVSRFRDALAINPRRPDVLVSLGETLYFRQQYAESIQAYRLALEQAPAWPEARRGMVHSLMGEGQHDEAAKEIARILEAEPTNAEAWMDQGDVAIRRGDEALARECWRRAATVEGRSDDAAERALSRLADMKRGQGTGNRNSSPRS